MVARKKYSKEFKLDAVSLVTEQNYTRNAWIAPRVNCDGTRFSPNWEY